MDHYRIITSATSKKEEKIPITGIDMCASPATFAFIFCFNYTIEEEKFIENLKTALSYYEIFSGRVHSMDSKKPYVLTNNAGILLLSSTRKEPLPEISQNSPLFEKRELVFHIDQKKFDENTPLLQVFLRNYENGSIVTFSASHIMCDGTSLMGFVKSLSDIYSGIQPAESNTNKIKLDGFPENDNPSSGFPVKKISDLSTNDQPVAYESSAFRISIRKLQKSVSKLSSENHPFITLQDMIGGLTWKSISEALHQSRIYKSHFSYVCSTRKTLGLDNFIGNCGCVLEHEFSTERTTTEPIEALALKLRGKAKSVSEQDVIDDAGFWKKNWNWPHREYIHQALSHTASFGVLYNNLTILPAYEISFGGGSAAWFDLCNISFGRTIVVTRSPSEYPDCVDFRLTLPANEASNFKKNLERNLDKIEL